MDPRRILIVADKAAAAKDTQRRLAAMGYQPLSCVGRVEQALTFTEQQHPELVLMDIQERGAAERIAVAREIRRRSFVPVVFLSARREKETLERAGLAEPFGCIVKPFDDGELKCAVEIALYKHRTEQQIRRLKRLYDVLSEVNQAIVRANSRAELLTTVCRLVVEHCAIDPAWIGWLDWDSSHIKPVARFGKSSEILSECDFFADGRPQGQCNPGKAMRADQELLRTPGVQIYEGKLQHGKRSGQPVRRIGCSSS